MKKHLPIILFFGLLTVLVIFLWFRHGLIYGGGDVGLTTYNPKRIVEMISSVWWDETAPGFPRPQGLASLPTEIFLSFLQTFGLPFFAIQATFFGILLFAMSLGMYILSLEFLGKDQKKTATLAALFYIVNPYMMVQVWHRFVHSTFFFAAGIPFILLFWIKWIEKRELIYLILFVIFNFLFSFMFSTLAFSVTLWGLLIFYSLFSIFVPWQGRKKLAVIAGLSLVGFLLWILTSSWWLIPVFFVSPAILSTQHSSLNSIITLLAIGKQSILPYSLAGLNPFYLYFREELGQVFSNPLFLITPYLSLIVIFIGMYYSFKKSKLIFWPLLFLTSLFFAKGSAPPFEQLFLFGFNNFFVLGVLRNPFEKIGILIPLSSSLLFAVGFIISWTYFKRKNNLFGKALLFLILGFFFAIFHWPFWSGKLHGTIDRPNFVEVPQAYHEANNWISQQRKSGNILHLPLPVSEGLSYRWEYGYSGVDSTTDFFTSNPSISMGFNVHFLDNALKTFNLMTEVTEMQEQVRQLFKIFNVRFIVLHLDIDWPKTGVKSPQEFTGVLDRLSFLKKQKEVGQLVIYEVADNDYLDKLYIQHNFDYLYDFKNDVPNFDTPWALYLRRNPYSLSLSDYDEKGQYSSGDNDPSNLLVIPTSVRSYFPLKKLETEETIRQLPAVKLLPNSPFYTFIRIKELLHSFSPSQSLDNLALEYASKRLVESYHIQQKTRGSIASLIKDYLGLLPKGMDRLNQIIQATTITKEAPAAVKNLLNNHEIILESLNKNANASDKEVTTEALKLLREEITKLGIVPNYRLDAKQETVRRVHNFLIPKSGPYEITLADSASVSPFKDRLRKLEFRINGNTQERVGTESGSIISYGDTFLDKGNYEIDYPQIFSDNLYQGKKGGSEELEITSNQHQSKDFEIPVEPFYPGSTYAISFDFWVKSGSEPKVLIIQDSDPTDPFGVDETGSVRSYQLSDKIKYDPYNRYWRTYSFSFPYRGNSSKLILRISAIPWDDCEILLAHKKSQCTKVAIRENYERPSTIVIKNIKIFRVLTNPLFLRSKGEKNINTKEPENITYTKLGSTEYKGDFTLTKPGFFVFSETFDKGWTLTLDDQNTTFEPKIHLLANMYANAWFIDKSGAYKFKLEYKPQRYFYLGIYIGLVTFAILSLILSVKKIGQKINISGK